MWKLKVGQMSTPVKLKSRVETVINGQIKIEYQDKENPDIFCNFKNKGGTETLQDNTLMVEDTAEIVTWYRPDISEKDIIFLDDSKSFEIINIENIEMRNQYLQLKVKRLVLN